MGSGSGRTFQGWGTSPGRIAAWQCQGPKQPWPAPDLSRAGPYLGGWTPHRARQGLLGWVTGPVLGEGEPPPVLSESGIQPVGTAEGRAVSWNRSTRETGHLASGTKACLAASTPVGTCMNVTPSTTDLSGRSGASPAAWLLRGAALPAHPSGSLGPAGGTGCLSKLSAAGPSWPGPRSPFQHRRPPPAPAPTHGSRSGAGESSPGTRRVGWLDERGPGRARNFWARCRPWGGASTGGWLSMRIPAPGYSPHLRPLLRAPRVSRHTGPGGALSPRREAEDVRDARLHPPPAVPTAGGSQRCQRAPCSPCWLFRASLCHLEVARGMTPACHSHPRPGIPTLLSAGYFPLPTVPPPNHRSSSLTPILQEEVWRLGPISAE